MYPLFHRIFVGLSSTTFARTMPLKYGRSVALSR